MTHTIVGFRRGVHFCCRNQTKQYDFTAGKGIVFRQQNARKSKGAQWIMPQVLHQKTHPRPRLHPHPPPHHRPTKTHSNSRRSRPRSCSWPCRKYKIRRCTKNHRYTGSDHYDSVYRSKKFYLHNRTCTCHYFSFFLGNLGDKWCSPRSRCRSRLRSIPCRYSRCCTWQRFRRFRYRSRHRIPTVRLPSLPTSTFFGLFCNVCRNMVWSRRSSIACSYFRSTFHCNLWDTSCSPRRLLRCKLRHRI